MKSYILALDQGTTGTRAFIFDARGKVVGTAYKEFTQYFPKPGWVEHDAEEIWDSCTAVIRQAIAKAKIRREEIAAIGITNQRETSVLWDRGTSKPVYRAIVWQCRRTADFCASPSLKKYELQIRKKTGLVLDAYFSATKISWLLSNVKGLRAKVAQGKIAFGTMDSWLIWKLTGGASHASDATNASRTLIFNIEKGIWDDDLLKIFKIPRNILPRVMDSGSIFGHTAQSAVLPSGIPIAAVLGDQQAALYGQGCHRPGTVKNTYGTGCFLVLNTGKKLIRSNAGLLTTVAADAQGKPVYALEGSIFIAGAVIQWLRDQLKVIADSSASEKAIAGLKDTGGVYFVPAFVGLGAPYWDSNARGTITGLTRGANVNHIIRAALEAIAYQTKDVFSLMEKAHGKKIKELKVDGGACRNNFLMQFQADIFGARVVRPRMVDSTAQGVAHLAGVTIGLWKPQQLARMRSVERLFTAQMKPDFVDDKYQGWLVAIKQARTT